MHPRDRECIFTLRGIADNILTLDIGRWRKRNRRKITFTTSYVFHFLNTEYFVLAYSCSKSADASYS